MSYYNFCFNHKIHPSDLYTSTHGKKKGRLQQQCWEPTTAWSLWIQEQVSQKNRKERDGNLERLQQGTIKVFCQWQWLRKGSLFSAGHPSVHIWFLPRDARSGTRAENASSAQGKVVPHVAVIGNYPRLAAHPQKEEHHSLHHEGSTQKALKTKQVAPLQAGKAARKDGDVRGISNSRMGKSHTGPFRNSLHKTKAGVRIPKDTPPNLWINPQILSEVREEEDAVKLIWLY